jgi:hypothetical protein
VIITALYVAALTPSVPDYPSVANLRDIAAQVRLLVQPPGAERVRRHHRLCADAVHYPRDAVPVLGIM